MLRLLVIKVNVFYQKSFRFLGSVIGPSGLKTCGAVDGFELLFEGCGVVFVSGESL